MIRVTVFNEFRHERIHAVPKALYPEGIHAVLADFLRDEDVTVRTVTLDTVAEDLSAEALAETDVLLWWGHLAHAEVPDEVAVRVRDAVLRGMGAIFLHSGHHSKPFRLLMGTSCNLTWRESNDSELLWVTNPAHPIVQGIDRFIHLPAEETYGEPFVIPNPDEILFLGSYSGGEAFRSGCLFRRGNGQIFYFQPGHETFPTYYIPEVQTVIRNAVRFVAPRYRAEVKCPHVRKWDDPAGYVI